MNYRQERAAQSAKAKIAQDYAQSLAQYGYNAQSGTLEQYPSELELQHAANEMKLLRLKMSADLLNKIANPEKKASCGCGCSGGKSSTTTTTRQTKSKPNYFAKEMERICRERADEQYESFCSRYCL